VTEETELYRQIHPNFFQNGQPTSVAFRPFPKDQGHLSVYDGDQIRPEQTYKHYTEDLKYKSAGVMAVNVRECCSLDLPPCPSPEIFREHAHLDFNGLEKKQIDSKSKALRAFALDRDWVYRVEDE